MGVPPAKAHENWHHNSTLPYGVAPAPARPLGFQVRILFSFLVLLSQRVLRQQLRDQGVRVTKRRSLQLRARSSSPCRAASSSIPKVPVARSPFLRATATPIRSSMRTRSALRSVASAKTARSPRCRACQRGSVRNSSATARTATHLGRDAAHCCTSNGASEERSSMITASGTKIRW
jgi:hypothetical protein